MITSIIAANISSLPHINHPQEFFPLILSCCCAGDNIDIISFLAFADSFFCMIFRLHKIWALKLTMPTSKGISTYEISYHLVHVARKGVRNEKVV